MQIEKSTTLATSITKWQKRLCLKQVSYLSKTQSQVLLRYFTVWVANADFIVMSFYELPEQVLAPLVVPHKQIGDLNQVNTICWFLLDMQKHKVMEPGLSRGWAQVSLDLLWGGEGAPADSNGSWHKQKLSEGANPTQ